MAALFVRFYLPAESAVQGDTLWIVAIWIVCSVVWLAAAAQGRFPSVRLDWADAALILWIGSQLISAIAVVLGSGDKRSAVNMAWESLSVGLIWAILRHALRNDLFFRSLIQATIVSGVTVAGLGLYQHYVSHPQLVAEYGPLFDQLRSGTPAESLSARQKLANEGIPTEGSALTLFEKRLRDSREPVGLFALANTLGGCLAVCLVLAMGQAIGAQCPDRWSRRLPIIASVAVIAWCLLLTKSRTAWVGTAVGISVLILPRIGLVSKYRKALIGGALLAIVVAGLLVRFGGLDRQVLSEAPKSLAYRLQYWQATSRLIADHLWLGVGPGNFRQHYLKYKLPEASEEIADPHNMIFDVAATGGISSAIGLLLFLGIVGAGFNKLRPTPGADERVSKMSAPASTLPVKGRSDDGRAAAVAFWFAGMGAPIAFASLMGFAGEWEDRLLVLSVVWFAVAAWFELTVRVISQRTPQSGDMITASRTAFAAFVTLAIHLLGAGGIAMPGVSQWLVVLAAMSLGCDPVSSTESTASRSNSLLPITGAAALVAGFAALMGTALLPVIECQKRIRHGDQLLNSRGDYADEARNAYLLAAKSDTLSPTPWRRLFELNSSRENQSNELFDSAVQQLQESMKLDPVNFWGLREMGALWESRWRATRQPEDILRAIDAWRRANQVYPTNAEIMADLAVALEKAGDRTDAINMARNALLQDEISRKWGHVDRYLPEMISIQLRQLTELSPPE